MGPIFPFLTSLFAGEAFSEGVESAKEGIKHHITERDFIKILDEFDQKFIEDHDIEIDKDKFDIQVVKKNRATLIFRAKEYLKQDNSNYRKNLKKEFINTGYEVIADQSTVAKLYLGYFYDLVFWKETKEISNELRVLINAHVNVQHDINQGFDQRLTDLEDAKAEQHATTFIDFSEYYRLVEKRFTSKKRGNHKKLVGEYPDEEAYIEVYLSANEKSVPALSYLEKWFCEEESETMLIYGEPGHGKSTLCDKVVVEYKRGNFLKNIAKNVIAVSLNIGENHRIINDKEVDLEAALSWDGGKKTFTFEECRGALLFMDGFDELIDEAKKAGITNIVSFMRRLDKIAFDYDIHIVVLSRTIAVNDYLNEQAIKEKSFRMMPITKDQQDDWLKEHREYDDYQEIYRSIRDGNKEMSNLLGIPLLFRMIVNSRFDKASTNVVELYDRLTDHLLEKRNICEIDDKEQVVSGLCELAYNIYCNDTDTVTVPENQWDTRWIFAFYIKQVKKRVLGFFHRSFYQCFLARYFYTGILNTVTDDQAERFIGSFAERELDNTIRQYLTLMINEGNRVIIYNNLKLVINALVRTEAYLNLEPRYHDGNAEKTKLGRTINIYRNTLHLCAVFSYVIEKPFRGGIDIFLRTYPSYYITIRSAENKRADLREADLRLSNLYGADLRGSDLFVADLREADLREADLREADLSGASLRRANLRRANLFRANLIGADLSGADLSGADLKRANLFRANLFRANLIRASLVGADLSEANLIGADLSGADLRGSDLSGANLREADLSGANLNAKLFNDTIIDINKKEMIDPYIEGYETIVWVSEPETDIK